MSEEFQTIQKALKQIVSREIKKLKKREITAQLELEKCLNWENFFHEAELIQANLYRIPKKASQITLLDWKDQTEKVLFLDPSLPTFKEVEKRFNISKKLKKGIPFKQQYLENIQKKIESCKEHLLVIETAQELETLKNFQPVYQPILKEKVKYEAVKLPFYQFFSESGLKILAGKNAKQNEHLTFSIAHGNDLWMHVTHLPGSHVIIQSHGKDVDEEALKDAFQVALHFSKAKDEAEICLTQKKFVSRFGKGAVGKVHVSKHQNIFVRKDEERFKKLKLRS